MGNGYKRPPRGRKVVDPAWVRRRAGLSLSGLLMVVLSPWGAALPVAAQDSARWVPADTATVRWVPADTAAVRWVPADTATVRLEPIMVTVSRLPLRPSQSGFAVTVLPATALRLERPPYAAEALRELPGAFIDEATGPGGPTILRLRGGEEVFTQILMDGVQVNENGGYFDFQGVTLTNVGQIEVARGPQSALYGSSAVSGVVQFLTPAGEPGPPRFGGTLEGGGDVGSGRSFRTNATALGGSPRLLYSGGAGVAYNRGIYELPQDTWTRDGSLRLDGYPGDRFHLTGIVRFVGVDSKHPVRDPGITRVPLDPNARLERDRFVFTTRARFDHSPRLTHGLNVSAFRQDFRYVDEKDDIEPLPDIFVLDADLVSASDFWRATVEYLGSYTSNPDPVDAHLAVAYGAQWAREDLDTSLAGDFGDAEAAFERQSVEGFADLRARLHPRLDLMMGVRGERYEGLGTELTPRGSVLFGAIPDLVFLRVAAGRAYKVPNLREQFQDDPFIAPNPDLEAETSVSWEIGADVDAGPLGLSATGFHQEYGNLIRTVPHENEPRLQSRNVGKSRAWGLEVGASYRFGPGLVAGLEAARTWTEIVDNAGLPPDQYPEGGTLPFRPGFIGSVDLRADLGRRTVALVRASYLGDQVVLSERFSGQRVVVDGYLRINGTVSYLIADRRTLYLRVGNLLDATYETAFDRPGAPLTLGVGIAIDP
jgi:vitamin B12 transporter